nr:MAG: hypothetical protein [Bacteriophage sp.]
MALGNIPLNDSTNLEPISESASRCHFFALVTGVISSRI